MAFIQRALLPVVLTGRLRSNYIHYLFDIAWWGLYNGTIVPFINIYAVRVGATNEQIGLINAAPAALALLFSLPAGRLLRSADARKATGWGAFIQRMQFLGYVLIPWLVPIEHQVVALILLTVSIGMPSAVLGITFNKLFIEAIPSDWRGQLVGTRIALFSVLTFICTLLSGQILNSIQAPLGYQIIFFIGAIGGIMTAFHLWLVHPLNEGMSEPLTVSAAAMPSTSPDRAIRSYKRILLVLFLFNFTNFMVAPLVPIFSVNNLELTDAVISLGTALNTFIVFLVSLYIARLTRRMGNQRATALGAVLIAGQSLVLALARDPGLYLVSMLIGGLGSGVLSTAQYNYNLDGVPAEQRTTWLSRYVVMGNSALLLGSLLGPALASVIQITPALWLFSILRLVSAAVIIKWGR